MKSTLNAYRDKIDRIIFLHSLYIKSSPLVLILLQTIIFKKIFSENEILQITYIIIISKKDGKE